MNKKNLLCLLPLALASCGVATAAYNATDNETAAANFSSFFKNSYSVLSQATNNYDGKTYLATDEVSSTNKASFYYGTDGVLASSTFITSKNGYAYEEYLDINNTISTRSIGSSKVAFSDYYGSPLAKISASAKDVLNYFTVTMEDTDLVFTASETAMAKATLGFNNFFSFYGDAYSWDAGTLKQSIKNLEIRTDAEGVPQTMSFTKVKKDRYGGISEDFYCMLNAIDAVETLKQSSYSGSTESYDALNSAMTLLAEKIAVGNFAETITNPLADPYTTYHNYYDFDEYGNGAMLCDIPWYASGYGTTYIGLAYSTYYGGYYMAAVSPESDYYGAANSNDATALSECLPQILNISKDFFAYDEEKKTYTFDLKSFMYDDYYFSFDIMDVLFGTADPLADKFGYYLSDAVSYAFDFQTLTIQIDEVTGLPSFTLVYNNYEGGTTTATASFGSFGEVDLANDATLGYAYSLLCGE